MNNYLLSICIPIYNREEYLNKMLNSFLKEKELFINDIHLFVSDNCSEDNLKVLCEQYIKEGLSLEYHRNTSNLGMDGNFTTCFLNAKGKYMLLLGSDDVPLPGSLRLILDVLKNNDIGLLHLSNKKNREGLTLYCTSDEIIKDIGYWITYISSNVIRTNCIKGFDFSRYEGTLLTQVPLYIETIISNPQNGILGKKIFEKNNTINSGYNPFKVFGVSFLDMMKEAMNNGDIKDSTYKKIKKDLLNNYLASRFLKNKILKVDRMDVANIKKNILVNCSMREYYLMILHSFLYPFKYIFDNVN